MYNKQGFTLIEMMLVLFIISITLLLLPFYVQHDAIYLKGQIMRIKENLLLAQGDAIRLKQIQPIRFLHTKIKIGEQTIYLGNAMQCDGLNYFYTPEGKVPFAQSITCSIKKHHKTLVIQLGSGQIDIR